MREFVVACNRICVIDLIKKKDRLVYRHFTGLDPVTNKIWIDPKWTDKELKVICKERWGSELVVKCAVITKRWYKEVYLTRYDFLAKPETGITRVTWKK